MVVSTAPNAPVIERLEQAPSDVRCCWRWSQGTRRATRFARVRGASLSETPQQNAIR